MKLLKHKQFIKNDLISDQADGMLSTIFNTHQVEFCTKALTVGYVCLRPGQPPPGWSHRWATGAWQPAPSAAQPPEPEHVLPGPNEHHLVLQRHQQG